MANAAFRPKVSLSPGSQARVALMRFGLGPRPGVAARLSAQDGAAFQACLEEVFNPAALLIPDEEVVAETTENSGGAVALTYETCCRLGSGLFPPSTGFLPQPKHIVQVERVARYAKALEPDVGFAERLVHFWSNHFSIFVGKGGMVQATVGNFERAVIRPRALGKFSDLLKAAYQHTAMICNLDNHLSMGRNSPFARDPRNKSRVSDINENLAREIFELHTLGIDGGHSQDDVIALAKVLTGWTIYPPKKGNVPHPMAGQFYFEPAFHEPGAQTVLGTTYSQTGIDQGLAVLDALARHPATAQHIAYKLIRHFITDEPPPTLVAYLARLFRFTGGDLQVMARALISLPQFWTAPTARLVQPLQWQMSVIRGMDVGKEVVKTIHADRNGNRDYWMVSTLNYSINILGQAMWARLTPDGFPDDNYVWMTPNDLRVRKDVACYAINYGLLPNGKSPRPPSVVAADLLSGFAEAATIPLLEDMQKKKQSDRSCLAILFTSPEYILR